MGTLWNPSCCGCPDIANASVSWGTPGVELDTYYALVCPYNRYEGPDDSGEPTDSFWPMSVDSCWLSFHDSVIQRIEGCNWCVPATLHLGFYFRRPFFVGCCIFNACELSILSMDVGTYYILLCSAIIWMTRSLVPVPLTTFSVSAISSTHESCPWLSCTQLYNMSTRVSSLNLHTACLFLQRLFSDGGRKLCSQ